MKQSEIIHLNDQELREKIDLLQDNLSNLIMSHNVATIENPMSIRETRKDIARLKTELTKRKKAAAAESNKK